MKAAAFGLAAAMSIGALGFGYAQTAGAQSSGAQQPPGPASDALPQGFQTTPLMRTSTTGDGIRIEYPRTENPEVIAVIGTVAPGGRTPRHQHPIPTFVYVMEGSLEVRTDGRETRTYAAGQTFIESQNLWHQAFNPSQTTPARILVVFMGEQGKPTTVAAQQ